MIVTFGKRLYGRVDEQDGTCIATMFAYVQFLPFIPLGSYLVLEESGKQFKSIPLGFDARSVLMGYFRVWGTFGTIGLLIAGYAGLRHAPDLITAFGASMLGVLALAALIASFAWVGRLSEDQRAERLVYKRFAGYAIDVALLGDARSGLAERLRAVIAERVKELAASGYRTVLDPAEAWRNVAVDPNVKDPALLEAALTLARVEWSLASGPARTSLAEAHRRIWLRIREEQVKIVREAAKITGRSWAGPIIGAVAVLLTVGFYGSALVERASMAFSNSVGEARLAPWMGRPGAAVLASTPLKKNQSVFVMSKRFPWSDETPRAADVVEASTAGDVRVRYFPSAEEETLPRAKLRLRAGS